MKLVRVKIRTSSEAVAFILSQSFIDYTWKRVSKMSVEDGVIRVFKNELDEYCSVVSNDMEARLFEDMDMTKIKPIIDEIKRVSKYYYTHDYGSVYLNPYTLDLIAIGGDGGYMYSKRPQADVIEELESDEFDYDAYEKGFVEFNEHEKLKCLNSVEWEAETSPSEPEFIEICTINYSS
jgi:hypothetical protein